MYRQLQNTGLIVSVNLSFSGGLKGWSKLANHYEKKALATSSSLLR
jgi:hypothetical protein